MAVAQACELHEMILDFMSEHEGSYTHAEIVRAILNRGFHTEESVPVSRSVHRSLKELVSEHRLTILEDEDHRSYAFAG